MDDIAPPRREMTMRPSSGPTHIPAAFREVAQACLPRLEPADRRGVAVVGAGHIVDVAHLPAYRMGGVPVVGLYDVVIERARRVAARHDVRHVYASLDELVDDDRVEVVDVAVPATEQPGIVRRMLAAGRHVLCQKPFATTLEIATELTERAERAGLTIAVNQQLRYEEGVAAAREMVVRGWVGEPAAMLMGINICTDFAQFPRLRDLDRFEILYHSIHYFDAVRFVLGEPVCVFCAEGRRGGQAVRGATRTVATICYAGGRVAAVHVNHENREGDAEAAFRIDGSAGAIKGTLGALVNYPGGEPDTLSLLSSILPTRGWAAYPISRRWIPDAFLGPMADLLQSLATKTAPLTSARDNLRTLVLVEALDESIRTGRTIAVPEPPTEAEVGK